MNSALEDSDHISLGEPAMGHFVSRLQSFTKLLELLRTMPTSPGPPIVFVWSPPKSGITTFFNEFAAFVVDNSPFHIRVIDVRQSVGESLEIGDDLSNTILILDELDYLTEGQQDAILTQLPYYQACQAVVLSGNSHTRTYASKCESLKEIVEFSIHPLMGPDVAKQLVLEPLYDLGYETSIGAAEDLCQAAGGHLPLINKLVQALLHHVAGRPRGLIEAAVIRAFLAKADDHASDFFDELAARIKRDQRSLYALIGMLNGAGKESTPLLKDYGILSEDGDAFISETFRSALRKRCSPLDIAQEYGQNGMWGEALEFYDNLLSRWSSALDQTDKTYVLLQAMNACMAEADTLHRYIGYALQLSQMCDPEYRRVWIERTLIPQVTELLIGVKGSKSELILNTITQAVNAITRTNRVRLYLIDSTGGQLVCRAAVGAHAEEFKKESAIVESNDWMVTPVYRSGQFASVDDPTSNPNCNHDIARRLQLSSCWLFPILDYSDEHGNKFSGNGQCIGVLCVDNPEQVPEPPSLESEKELVATLLKQVALPLVRAKTTADRLDLQLRMSRLTSLHVHLLTRHTQDQVLNDLFAVASELQPNLSMIVVRLKRGSEESRLAVESYWPPELARVFERADINIVDRNQSSADPNHPEQSRFTFNVHDVKNQDGNWDTLKRFLAALADDGIRLSVGSQLSFNIVVGDEYLGTCNFYTKGPRKFLTEEHDALLMIVKQAAVALHNAQQIASAERQKRGLQILSESIGQVTQRLDPSEIIKHITQRLGELFKAESASFLSVDDNNHILTVDYTWPEDSIIPGKQDMNIPWGKGVTGRALVGEKTFVLSSRDPDWHDIYEERVPGIHTSAAFPVMDRTGKITAVLALETQDEEAFSPNDIKLIETVVSEIPVALNNLKLIYNLEEANRKLQERRWVEAIGYSVTTTLHAVIGTASPMGPLSFEAKQYCSDLKHAMERNAVVTPNIIDEISIRLDKVNTYAERLIKLARDINLVSAKPQIPTPIHLISFVKEIVLDLQENLNLEGMEWQYKGLDVPVQIDVERLRRIIECLLENAYKASANALKEAHRAAKVIVTTRLTGDGNVTIDIADSGLGVRKGVADKIIQEMVQSNWHGTGVGLFLCGRSAGMLGGHLFLLKNTAEGATFRLTLPLEPLQYLIEESNGTNLDSGRQ